jgi:hypothetical protein
VVVDVVVVDVVVVDVVVVEVVVVEVVVVEVVVVEVVVVKVVAVEVVALNCEEYVGEMPTISHNLDLRPLTHLYVQRPSSTMAPNFLHFWPSSI